MTRKSFIHPLLSFLLLFLPLFAAAQPAGVKKAAQSVFTLTTYNADGTILATSHGVFTGAAGEGVAMWNPFKGAARAVVIDARGRQYDVDVMLGVSENYDLCRFRIKGTSAAPALPLTASGAAASPVYVVGYDLKKPDIRSLTPERTEKFMTSYNYYVFNDADVSAVQLGCPVVNASGELLGIMQRPETGGQAFAADTRVTTTFKLTAFSINDATLRATGIRTALPADEKDATVMLLMAAGSVDSTKYEAYIDDFIRLFPTATAGYNTRANALMTQGKLQAADDMLQTELKKAAQKDVAYSNYADIVYRATIYRVDTTFTKWSFDKALELAQEADKLKPQANYRHQQAQILFAMGRYQDALNLFTALQQTELGKNGEVYYEAARCKAMLKAPKSEVMALLDSAVNVQKGQAAAPYYLARGQQYDADGDYRKAFLDYMTYDSLVNNRGTADFYYAKYRCEMKLRQYQIALNDIAHAIVLNRTEPVYYAEMASLQLRVNRLSDAIATCDMAFEVPGADQLSDLYIIRGIARCESKQTAEGLADLRKAQEMGDARAEKLIAKYK